MTSRKPLKELEVQPGRIAFMNIGFVKGLANRVKIVDNSLLLPRS